MENLLRSLETVGKMPEDGENTQDACNELLLILGNHYSKMEIDGGNDPDFTTSWNKIIPLISYSEGTIEKTPKGPKSIKHFPMMLKSLNLNNPFSSAVAYGFYCSLYPNSSDEELSRRYKELENSFISKGYEGLSDLINLINPKLNKKELKSNSVQCEDKIVALMRFFELKFSSSPGSYSDLSESIKVIFTEEIYKSLIEDLKIMK